MIHGVFFSLILIPYFNNTRIKTPEYLPLGHLSQSTYKRLFPDDKLSKRILPIVFVLLRFIFGVLNFHVSPTFGRIICVPPSWPGGIAALRVLFFLALGFHKRSRPSLLLVFIQTRGIQCFGSSQLDFLRLGR